MGGTTLLVERALYDRLASLADGVLVGVTSLADGADALFAETVLTLGGRLEVVLPAADHRVWLPPEFLDRFDHLLERASAVEWLPYALASEEAFMAAGRVLVDRADVLVAVWDGRPARGGGGTGDVVAYARQRQVPVEVVWPPGSARD
jgi:hypothetical protein